MHSDDLEARPRAHATAGDRGPPEGEYLVARLEGRSFARLLRSRPELDAPYDLRVRDILIATTDHLLQCALHRGLAVVYGYTQSDEISLLLRRDRAAVACGLDRLLSVFAGEASAKFTLLLGALACFDCRISGLADGEQVVAFLGERQADATRGALAAHCDAAARAAGITDLQGMAPTDQHALLARLGVDFAALPAWHRYGAGLHWADLHAGASPLAPLRRLRVELELAHGDAYAAFVREQLARAPVTAG